MDILFLICMFAILAVVAVVYLVKCVWDKPDFQKRFHKVKCYLAARLLPLYSMPFCYWRWYAKNGYFLLSKDDTIILSDKRCLGYGVRPFGRIISMGTDSIMGDYYEVLMEIDDGANFFDWIEDRPLDYSFGRKANLEKHFKTNIETQFKKIW